MNLTNQDIVDLMRGVIVDTLQTVVKVLDEAPESMSANEVAQRLGDEDTMRMLEGQLVAAFDQAAARFERRNGGSA